jgi:hypothetical protein
LAVRDLESRLAPAVLTAGNVGTLTTVTQQPATVTPSPTVTPKATVQAAAVAVPVGPPAGQQAPIRGNGVVYETVTKNWGDGASINITIKNDGKAPMVGWRVEFDAPFNITNWWNAQFLSQSGTHYVFKNIPGYYNAVIPVGGSITFGFNTSFDPGTPTYISSFTLNGKQPDTGGNIGGSTTGTVGQRIRSSWDTGTTNDITIQNTGNSTMLGWTVEFDAPFTITDVWNAQLVSHAGNHYVFQNIPGLFNAPIKAHLTGLFGFNAMLDAGTARTIQNVTLNGNSAGNGGGGGGGGGGNTGGSTTGTFAQSIISTWGDGATNNITVKNTGTTAMKGWTVEFDAAFTVAEVWNAQLMSSSAIPGGGFHYVFQNTPGLFNSTIKPNGNAVFGFNSAFPTGTSPAISNLRLNGTALGGGGGGGGGGNTGGSTTGTLTEAIPSQWIDGATINLSIKNTGTTTMKGWSVEFDAPFTITNSWNAQLVSNASIGNGMFHYVFQNIGGFWNTNIVAGGTVTFGLNTSFPQGTTPTLTNAKLNGTAVTIGGNNNGGGNNGGGNNGGGNTGGSTTGFVLQLVRNSSNSGTTNDVTVRNTGNTTMQGWTVEFDAPFIVTGFWDSQLVSNALTNGVYHYVFQSLPGSAKVNIPAGGNITFGFNTSLDASGNGTMANTKLNGVLVGNNGAGGTNNYNFGNGNGGGNNGGGNTGGSTTGFVLQTLRNQLAQSATTDVTVKNTGTSIMNGWTVEFDAPFTVTDFWNSQLISSASIGNGMFHYVFQNVAGSFNTNIPVNGTVMFGFNMTFAAGANPTMVNTKLDGIVVGNNGAGGTTDYGGGNNGGGNNGGGNTGGSTTGFVLQGLRNQLAQSATTDVTVKNTGTSIMNGWKVEFDAPFTVTDYWNSQLVSNSSIGNGMFHYVFQNVAGSSNTNVQVNGTVTFGFNMTFAAGANPTMVNTKLNGIVVGNNGAGGTTDFGGGNNNGGGSNDQNFTASITETAQDYGPGATMNVTIHNNGATPINGWTVEFDAPFTITSEFWNATLASSTANAGGGYHYKFNNKPNTFNANIPAGGTATFGFNTIYAAGGKVSAVTGVKLNGKAV